jgi:hypothetical protein
MTDILIVAHFQQKQFNPMELNRKSEPPLFVELKRPCFGRRILLQLLFE